MKKFIVLALAIAAFAACSKDEENPAPPKVQPANILYWDGTKLAVGRWGTVTHDNMLYTKFGSLVAFTIPADEDEW